MYTLEQLKEYGYNALWLCLWRRELNNYEDKKLNGEAFDQRKYEYACENFERYKNLFLASKKSLGYTDELDFMKDYEFENFSIKNGRYVGNLTDSEIFAATDKWFYGYPDIADHKQFEISHYVLVLSDPNDRTNVLYKDFR